MYDKFADYMYYLLISPLKRVKKAVNQWYILFKSIGTRYDEAMNRLSGAQDQTMLATCDPAMLQVHADDRGITRYAGETDDNFRIRIANYSEVLRLGGTDEGVLLAVRALGFEDPKIVLAKIYKSDPDRWAEFYVLLNIELDGKVPINHAAVKAAVRAAKYVGARDCYEYNILIGDVILSAYADCLCVVMCRTAPRIPPESMAVVRMAAEHHMTSDAISVEKWHDPFYWDGTYLFDGTKQFSSYDIKEDI